MRDRGINSSLAKEATYEGAKVADFMYWKSINFLPDRLRDRWNIKRKIIGIEYKGTPISPERWKEFRDAKGLSGSRNFTTSIRDDLRNLDPY